MTGVTKMATYFSHTDSEGCVQITHLHAEWPPELDEGEQTFAARSKQNPQVRQKKKGGSEYRVFSLLSTAGEFQTAGTIQAASLGADERKVERPLKGEQASE